MTALAISANRRYLAVSECGEKATITVFDLQHEQGRKRKVLSAGNVPVQEFVCMAFSPDSKYLLSQSGASEGLLMLWFWEKNRILTTISTNHSDQVVNQVGFASAESRQPFTHTPRLYKGELIFFFFVPVRVGQLQPL